MKRRTVALLVAVVFAVGVLITAPLVVAVVHQRRIDENANAISRIGRLERERTVDANRFEYETCLANLQTWTIADDFVLYETSPGRERSTLLGLLGAQPRCVRK